MALMDAGNRRHDLTRRAIATLQRVVVEKSLLHRVQRAIPRRYALDRRDLASLRLPRERQAAQYAAPVKMHGACAALPLVTTLLGAKQADPLPKSIEQSGPRIDA